MTSFVDLLNDPYFETTPELTNLIQLQGTINFWEELIKHVVPDASVQEYLVHTYNINGPGVTLRHHSFGENTFEIYSNGDFRGSANIVKIVDFFNAANVPFL